MTIETSPEEFTRRFAAYAAQGVLYAQPEGSSLLEFSAGGRVLYLLDRSGPYAVHPGPARVLVSGVLADFAPVEEREEALSVQGMSALDGVGEVIHAESGTVVLRARLVFVLSGAGSRLPAPGQWLRFTTETPLHGFLI